MRRLNILEKEKNNKKNTEKTIAKNSLLLFITGIIFNLREPFILDPAKLPP